MLHALSDDVSPHLNQPTNPGALIAILLVVLLLLSPLGKMIADRHALPPARVRGYVRQVGRLYEYGLLSTDDTIRQRLGRRRSMLEAEEALNVILSKVREARLTRYTESDTVSYN